MKEYTTEDLVSLLLRIYKSSRVDGVLEFEVVGYPIELYDELRDTLLDLTADINE